ncbi:hypothetical protein MN608_08641 [Microdochium nivale]|nr:hypothetical protein MN608_08641 [Microdochium nivale]
MLLGSGAGSRMGLVYFPRRSNQATEHTGDRGQPARRDRRVLALEAGAEPVQDGPDLLDGSYRYLTNMKERYFKVLAHAAFANMMGNELVRRNDIVDGPLQP